MTTTCPTCEYPHRQLWTYGKKPEFLELEYYNWIKLVRCRECKLLWASSPYEPYASYEFLAPWPYSRQLWEDVHAEDDGQTLRDWHQAMIREHWQKLPEDEQEFVQAWRTRTYHHYNCIDRGPEVPRPQRVETVADFEAIISGRV